MSGSFLRSGGMRASEQLYCCHCPLVSGSSLIRPTMQLPRAYVRSFLATVKVIRDSSSHLSPAASKFLSSSASASTAPSKKGFVSWYLGKIEACHLITKSLAAGAIFTAADISSQMITLLASDSLDWIRMLRMAGYGMLISGLQGYHCQDHRYNQMKSKQKLEEEREWVQMRINMLLLMLQFQNIRKEQCLRISLIQTLPIPTKIT